MIPATNPLATIVRTSPMPASNHSDLPGWGHIRICHRRKIDCRVWLEGVFMTYPKKSFAAVSQGACRYERSSGPLIFMTTAIPTNACDSESVNSTLIFRISVDTVGDRGCTHPTS